MEPVTNSISIILQSWIGVDVNYRHGSTRNIMTTTRICGSVIQTYPGHGDWHNLDRQRLLAGPGF
jgi:hypothetical protein